MIVATGRATSNAATFFDRTFFTQAKDLLSRPKGAYDIDLLESIVERVFGRGYSLELLGSEAESTYRATCQDGVPSILKVSDEPDARDSFSMQAAALTAARAADSVIVPAVLPTASGEALFRDEATGFLGYMQSALEGPLLRDVPIKGTHRMAFGNAAGAVSAALSRFDHPAANRPVLWNARSWSHLRDFAGFVQDPDQRRLAVWAMNGIEARVAPRAHALPWQVTHNDLSPSNTLILRDGFGVIDFGDAGFCLRLVDAATVAMYTIEDGVTSRLCGAEPAIAAFEAQAPLTSEEHDLLVPMVRGRAAALVLINAWRAELFPAEADYINKNTRSAIRALRAFDPDLSGETL